ncbi:hypothetical protein C8F04DRAFT_1116992 [Mycena alexandri]|uniref:Uncharacterized protein n=1 Tax=Mycena alexandri TaxID=1745969 RepID=A0AAD6WXS0_9AGAR|nr:hypothetical protein C8F04DRAFT_1116992 [Mycena alexandri]
MLPRAPPQLLRCTERLALRLQPTTPGPFLLRQQSYGRVERLLDEWCAGIVGLEFGVVIQQCPPPHSSSASGIRPSVRPRSKMRSLYAVGKETELTNNMNVSSGQPTSKYPLHDLDFLLPNRRVNGMLEACLQHQNINSPLLLVPLLVIGVPPLVVGKALVNLSSRPFERRESRVHDLQVLVQPYNLICQIVIYRGGFLGQDQECFR